MYLEYRDDARLYNAFGQIYAGLLFDAVACRLIPGAKDATTATSSGADALAMPLSADDRAAYAEILEAVAVFETDADHIGFFKPTVDAKFSAASSKSTKIDETSGPNVEVRTLRTPDVNLFRDRPNPLQQP